MKVHPDRVDGICHVMHLVDVSDIEEWVQHDDHYFVNQDTDDLHRLEPEDLQHCKQCHQERLHHLHRVDQLLRRHQPLRGLELFSGMCSLTNICISVVTLHF